MCAETVFVYKKDDLSFEVNVRGEPVLFNMEEVPDQSSFDLLDQSGIKACGPREYTLLFDPPFMTKDLKNPLNFKIHATRYEDEGLQEVKLRVSLKDYTTAPTLDIPIKIMIKPCQVSEIVPKDPSIKPSTVYLVSYPNQSFAITRYIPNPSCNFSESDFSYKITEQVGSLVPDWLTLNTKGDNIGLVAIPDISFNQNSFMLILTIFNEKLNMKIEH